MNWSLAFPLQLRDGTAESDVAFVEAALAVPWIDRLYLKVPHSDDIGKFGGPIWADPAWRTIVETLKGSRKDVTLGQSLWPSWAVDDLDRRQMFDPEHYREELRELHLNADLLSYALKRPVATLLDIEPYGNHPFAVDNRAARWQDKFRYGLTAQNQRAIKAAIAEATIDATATDAVQMLHLAEAANAAERAWLAHYIGGTAPEASATASGILVRATDHAAHLPPVLRVPLADHAWPRGSTDEDHFAYQFAGLANTWLTYKTYNETTAAGVVESEGNECDAGIDHTRWMSYLYVTPDARGAGKSALTVDLFYGIQWLRDVMEIGSDPVGRWRGLEEIIIQTDSKVRMQAFAEFTERGQPELSPGE